MTTESRKSWCNACNKDTAHDVVWESLTEDQLTDHTGERDRRIILCCRGCGESSAIFEIYLVRHEEYGDIKELIKSERQPPRLWHRLPYWLEDLGKINPDLEDFLKEVYSAANDRQIRLLSMGVRTVLDTVMNHILGGDIGTFETKLKKMVQGGHLTKQQKDHLSIVIDAGSAASHRMFRPSRELVQQMLVVAESLINQHYITGPMLETARKQIPPRPKRTKPPKP